MPEIRKINISCADGYHLTGTSYSPVKPKGAVMMAPATGIKKEFYHSFAMFLAKHHYGVICYDNRGIGESIEGPLKNTRASLLLWGQQDMPAVMERLMAIFPDLPYFLAGHSAGGQLVGLMPNSRSFASIFNVACSSGSLKNLYFPFKAKAHFFMNVFIPLSNTLLGYTHSPWLNMGEPLPPLVAAQWRSWCNKRGYIKTYLDAHPEVQHWYDELGCPALWLHFTDDDIANPENVQEMIKVFPKMKSSINSVTPGAYNLPAIGHMKFFSTKCQSLWDLALQWFENPRPQLPT